LAALCQIIPDGVVAFFPSYDYLSQVVSVWKKPIPNGNGQSTLDLLERKKKVLYESREAVTSTDALLQEYTNAVESGSGALLLSIVGGKLSLSLAYHSLTFVALSGRPKFNTSKKRPTSRPLVPSLKGKQQAKPPEETFMRILACEL
jgi:hypothetical protein